MTYTHLITAAQLQALQAQGQPLMVFDCSFDLTNPSAGYQQFLDSHIAGAIHADLDQHLSARHGHPGKDGQIHVAESDQAASGGRHPLPSRERFAQWLSSVGFRNDMQAVVYDRHGCNFCGRLWWMLKWVGHDAVAVLDGGLPHWIHAGGRVDSGTAAAHFQSNFSLAAPLRRLVSAATVEQCLKHTPLQQTLVDARAPTRFRGEVEPLDPVAGHIPGARNRPFSDNMALDGRFKPREILRAEFEQLLTDRDPATVVHQCGSGVSAIPNLLAMELAGYAPTALFAGSWSEWCSVATRPTAKS